MAMISQCAGLHSMLGSLSEYFIFSIYSFSIFPSCRALFFQRSWLGWHMFRIRCISQERPTGFTQLIFMILSSGLTCLHFTQPIRSHHLLHAPMIDFPNCTYYYRGPLEKWISNWADTHFPGPRSLDRTQWRDHSSPFGRFL
ncbi:hypothetical protein BJX62DRAFT_199490 [Aspergillus germanicus]